METRARKYREDVHLLEEAKDGIPDDQATEIDKDIEAKKSRYQGILQEYKAFSKKMGLPMQKERIYQDGLRVKMDPKAEEQEKPVTSQEARSTIGEIIDESDDAPIIWPERGERMGRLKNKEYRQYGKEKGIDIGGLSDTDLSEAAVHEVIEDAVKFLDDFPELREGHPQISFTAEYMNSSRSFAGTTNHLITLNADAYRNLQQLEDEYQKLVEKHWFPQGTDHHALIAHEIGHVIHNHYPEIKPIEIAAKISGKKPGASLTQYLTEHLSEYSSSYIDGREIISESFACVLTGVKNDFALKFVEECDKIIKKSRKVVLE